MVPLKVAFLWHFHQPYYLYENEFMLPWVRLHGVKDYFNLPELFHEFPTLKQTINVVPSLRMQLNDYISGRYSDKIQRLTRIQPKELTEIEKREILRLFVLCNVENMLLPYSRYKELYEKSINGEEAFKTFSEQDWLDMQVWYNLTWFGEFSQERREIKRLFKKGRNFNEEEKAMVLDLHIDVLNQIRPQLIHLQRLGQVEISVSPMYHPILPLLCDSTSVREAMPDAPLPDFHYKHPEDALAQVGNAIKFFEDNFGTKPVGMWPSEGSISDKALEILIKSGLKWAASDEEILEATLKNSYKPLEKYFPRKYKSSSGEIALFFRDHQLSDAIGFVYSRWEPVNAANDFRLRLNNIRNEIIKNYGEQALNFAVVPVILDGENCWEYYPENGMPFRRELYKRLTESAELKTVTYSEAIEQEAIDFLPAIEHIRAGSWINGNFKIWIGHEEERAAWSMLAKARKAVEERKPEISDEAYKKAMEEIYIAEGSDWFWWYGDEHVAENKYDFDVMFRWHISEIYKAIGLGIPEDVNIPINEQKRQVTLIQQSGEIHPVIDGMLTEENEWEGAGCYDAAASMSAMHQVGELINKIWFASDCEKVYFRCDISHKLGSSDEIEFQFIAPVKFSFLIKCNSIEFNSIEPLYFSSFSYAKDEFIEISFSRNLILKDAETKEKQRIELILRSLTEDGELFYPRQGRLVISL